MKFHTTHYHFDLLKDENRLSVFFEAIKQYSLENNNSSLIAFDIGCGSGILSFFAQPYFKEIIAIEIDSKVSICASRNLNSFKNVKILNKDAINFEFPVKADLIICEMLDTALIDEEQVPALNNAKKFLKKDGEIIPQAIFNFAELVDTKRHYIHYNDVGTIQDNETMSNFICYSQFNFKNEIVPEFQTNIDFKVKKEGKVNGIKLTSVMQIFEDIVCGPTPMLNPPIVIPLDETIVKCNDLITVKLKYIMGKGIETIESEIVLR